MIDALVYSNLLMLLVPTALSLGTYALLGLPASAAYLVCLSTGTFMIYQVDRGLLASPEDEANKAGRVAWIRNHRVYVRVSTAAAALAAGGAARHLHIQTLVAMAAMLVVGLAYALPILPGRRRLKSLPYMKAIIVGVVWSFSCVAIPALEAGRPWDRAVTFLFFYRLGWVLPNLLLSNWYDREGDRRAGIRTFAAHLSSSSVLAVCRSLLTLTALGACVAVSRGTSPLLFVDASGLILLLGLLGRGLPDSSRFYLLIIDALMVWPLVTAILATFDCGI